MIYINEYKYKIGENIINKSSNITIIDRKTEIVKQKSNNTKSGFTNTYIKYYRYKCNNCGWDCSDAYDKKLRYFEKYWISEYGLYYGKHGCSVCNGNSFTSPKINSICSDLKYQWMINYFQGNTYEEKVNEVSKYQPFSNKKYNFICPLCGRSKIKQINKLNTNHSLGCICSDGISYPNKFSYALFEQLPIDKYDREYSPDWANGYKFDNYFELNGKKYIVEMDGGVGHGNRKFKSKEKDLKGKEIDLIKDQLAKDQGITVIRIDCKISDVDYIKNNIKKSLLSELFDLDINWRYCDEFATKNLVKEVCEFYNANSDMQNYKIAEIFKLNKSTIGHYLRKGNKFGWCSYDYIQKNIDTIRKQGNNNGIKTKIIKNGEIIGVYNSASEIEKISLKEFGVKLWQTQISLCCKTHKKHKGFYFEYA